MKFISYLFRDIPGYGLLHPDGFVIDLKSGFSSRGYAAPDDLLAFIEAGDDALGCARALLEAAPVAARRDVSAIAMLAPLPRPARLRDASLFLEHMEASLAKLGRALSPVFREQAIFYDANHLVVHGTGADIVWPAESDWIDYELELACVIGRQGFRITPEAARDHIFGFTIFNDWSARDLQLDFMEAGLGPAGGKDFASSLGPCIATLDEFPDIYELPMTARINGELWSSGTTASMFHKWESALAGFSRLSPLEPGEVIGSGTVLNGCGFELDRRLEIGDLVELEISGIGILSNRIIRTTKGQIHNRP